MMPLIALNHDSPIMSLLQSPLGKHDDAVHVPPRHLLGAVVVRASFFALHWVLRRSSSIGTILSFGTVIRSPSRDHQVSL